MMNKKYVPDKSSKIFFAFIFFKYYRGVLSSILVIGIVVLSNAQSISKKVQCESIGNWTFNSFGTLKTCFMKVSTIIDESWFEIADERDETVAGLTFLSNKKIEFLPLEIANNFPELLGLAAQECSLTSVSRRNFKNLRKLRFLGLNYNKIRKIADNTFSDLIALEELRLSKISN